jgi:hypothetical protein
MRQNLVFAVDNTAREGQKVIANIVVCAIFNCYTNLLRIRKF